MVQGITQDLIRFVVQTRYEDLPEEVVHEAKRCLLDAVGCAVAGIATDKGKIAVTIARRLGGTEESSILGVGPKVSCASAAFANGELINGLDYDAIPHIHPYIIPPVLAMAESKKASGTDLILATVLAQEVSKRLTMALSNMLAKLTEEAKTPDVYGNSNECIFGATAGAAKILNMDMEKCGQAIGIAGYLCPLPVCRDWEATVPKSMIKYVAAGWLCQAAVMATLLANQGYTGNPEVLDSEYGFPRFYGAERWTPEMVVDRLGERWRFMEMTYKQYPCCRFFHGQLDCFIDIVETNNLLPDEIETVKSYALPFVASPEPYDVRTQVDTQFSVPFVFAVAAHRVRIGADWQDWATIMDPRIRGFMKKVTMHVDPAAVEIKRKSPSAGPARVEVAARGKVYVKETVYARGANFTELMATDEELVRKFRSNASRLLAQDKIGLVTDLIMNLEKVQDITELTRSLVL